MRTQNGRTDGQISKQLNHLDANLESGLGDGLTDKNQDDSH